MIIINRWNKIQLQLSSIYLTDVSAEKPCLYSIIYSFEFFLQLRVTNQVVMQPQKLFLMIYLLTTQVDSFPIFWKQRIKNQHICRGDLPLEKDCYFINNAFANTNVDAVDTIRHAKIQAMGKIDLPCVELEKGNQLEARNSQVVSILGKNIYRSQRSIMWFFKNYLHTYIFLESHCTPWSSSLQFFPHLM